MENKIYKTSSIESFSVESNEYYDSLVFIPHQRCVIERKFLLDYVSYIKSGWYWKSCIDDKLNVPRNIKNYPVVEEDNVVYTDSLIDHNPFWIHYDDSNIKNWLITSNWCYRFNKRNSDVIESIDMYMKGCLHINFGNEHNNICIFINADEIFAKEILNNLTNAIETHTFFKINNEELVFFSSDSNKQDIVFKFVNES